MAGTKAEDAQPEGDVIEEEEAEADSEAELNNYNDGMSNDNSNIFTSNI